MLRSLRNRRPRYADVAATLALVLGLGGTSYAAVLVTSDDIADNTIRSRDVRDGKLASVDLGDGQVRSVDVLDGTIGLPDLDDAAEAALQGQQGEPGEPGEPGAALAYGLLLDNATVVKGSANFDSTMVTEGTIDGLYCLHDLPFAFQNLQATPNGNTAVAVSTADRGLSSGCDPVEGTVAQVWIVAAGDNDAYLLFN